MNQPNDPTPDEGHSADPSRPASPPDSTDGSAADDAPVTDDTGTPGGPNYAAFIHRRMHELDEKPADDKPHDS